MCRLASSAFPEVRQEQLPSRVHRGLHIMHTCVLENTICERRTFGHYKVRSESSRLKQLSSVSRRCSHRIRDESVVCTQKMADSKYVSLLLPRLACLLLISLPRASCATAAEIVQRNGRQILQKSETQNGITGETVSPTILEVVG